MILVGVTEGMPVLREVGLMSAVDSTGTRLVGGKVMVLVDKLDVE